MSRKDILYYIVLINQHAFQANDKGNLLCACQLLGRFRSSFSMSSGAGVQLCNHSSNIKQELALKFVSNHLVQNNFHKDS